MLNRRRLGQVTLAACIGAPAWVRAQPVSKVQTLSGHTVEGQPYDLKAEAGKVVLIFVWSTDSAVCRDRMPELRLNYEAWRSKGFQLVALSVDRSLAPVKDYLGILDHTVRQTQRFPTLWRGASGHRDTFGPVGQTPTTFVLDRSHKVVNEIRGRIAPGLWDDIAELVLA